MSKLTIKHFLNEKLKPLIIGDKNEYPVYVQITHKRHVQQIKSLLLGYMTEERFEGTETMYIIRRETQIIESLYNYGESIITDYDIRKMSVTTRELLEWYTKPLNKILYELTEYYKVECLLKEWEKIINKKYNTNFQINAETLNILDDDLCFLKENKLEFGKIGINVDDIFESDEDILSQTHSVTYNAKQMLQTGRFADLARYRYGKRNDKTDEKIIKQSIEYEDRLQTTREHKTGSEEWKKAVLRFEKARFELEETYNLDRLLHFLNVYNFQTDSKVIERCKENNVDTDLINERIKQSFLKMIKNKPQHPPSDTNTHTIQADVQHLDRLY